MSVQLHTNQHTKITQADGIHHYYGSKSKALQYPTRRFRALSPIAAAVSLAFFGAAPLQAEEAAATTAISAEAGLEVITVTARKRVENVQDVPIAISVLTSQDLDKTGTYSTEQLTRAYFHAWRSINNIQADQRITSMPITQ